MESKKEFEFLCTATASPVDNRDWIFDNKDVSFPKKVDLRPKLTYVRNQGKYGSCYAFAACCAKEYQERLDYNFRGYFSPKFFYGLRENSSREGMHGRDVMKILKSKGVCSENSCPYYNVDESYDYSLHYKEARTNIIKSYAQIKELDCLCNAIHKNGVCLITFPVYKKDNDFWNKSSKDDKLQGGHAVAAVGYDLEKQHFIIRNSWGSGFGDKGYCYYKFEDWGKHWEIWTVVDDDSNVTRLDDPSKIDEVIDDIKDLKRDLQRVKCCIIS